MATPIFACGAECGANSAHFLPTGGGTFDTTTLRTGVRSLRTNAVAGDAIFGSVTLASSAIWVLRAYLRFASLPDKDTTLVVTSGSTSSGACFKQSDSKIYPGRGTGVAITFGSNGVSVTTGVWYRVDVRINVSANPWLIDVSVDGTATAQLSVAVAASSATGVSLGGALSSPTNPTFDIYFDDILASQTSADYPLGAGYVLSYIPNADGTHNVAGANDFERTLTGTDIDNATTTAWQLIADRPLPTTAVDFINGIAPLNATDYVEWQYEDSVEAVAPRTVEAIFVHHDASGAGTNSFTVTLREHVGATSANIFTGKTNVGATITYKRAHFATVPGTATVWTTTLFNALRSRFLVADHSPDPYIDAIMLEAEFVPAAVVDRVPCSTPYPQLLAH